jgi:xanthine dehydrogenase accessory factor
MAVPAVIEKVVSELEAGRRVLICAIVATRGSTPQPAGSVVCVDEAAQMGGTIGGGCAEAEVRRTARQILSVRAGAQDARRGIPHPLPLLTFRMDLKVAENEGMICGGEMDVAMRVLHDDAGRRFFRGVAAAMQAGETVTIPFRVATDDGPVEYRVHLEAPPRLVIAGGGHISRILARFSVPLGFRVTVVDDRPEYANAERFPPPTTVMVGDIAETISTIPMDANSYVVIVTRGHRHDHRALAAVLGSPARYIGMIGSRRKVDVVLNELRQAGARFEQLARVKAPIGEPIGAVTTEEIALSIAAELVRVRRQERPSVVEGPLPLSDVRS